MSCPKVNFTNISAGEYHSLGLSKDGSVFGWGNNQYGQIGVGQTNIPIVNNVTGIAAGYYHSLALLKDGRVTGWGRGSTNQVNGGQNGAEWGQIIIPVGIGNNAAAIAAGFYHSLALLKDGSVTGWGYNEYGQINIPVGIGSNATGIAAGAYHSLALLKDGRVTGWGYNLNGEINIPAGIGNNATGIVAEGLYSFALLKDGTVLAWGHNGNDVTNVPSNIQGNVIGIAGGHAHALALLKDGSVTGWGAGLTNTSTNFEYGQIIIPVGIGNNAVAIAAGFGHSLALLKDGRAIGWGLNGFGQATSPKCFQSITFPSIPIKLVTDPSFNLNVTSTNNTIPITYSSSNTSVATVSSNGTVTIVGAGTSTITASQSGNNIYDPASVSQTLTVNKLNQTLNFPSITIKYTTDPAFNLNVTSTNNTIPITYSTSNPNIATVSNNGILTIVGAGTASITASQAGNDVYNAASVTRELIVIQISTENFCNKISEISSKGWHSLALLKNGTVVAWTSPKLEQLVDLNSQGNLAPGGLEYNRQVLDVPLNTIQLVTGISASLTYNLALLKDGRVTGWGSNQYGQLNIPSTIQGNACEISAGSGHGIVLLKDGRVTGWGSNQYGQLNIPSTIQGNITGISAGYYHNISLLKNGNLSGWGFNSFGQLNIPTNIQGNITGISAGATHNLALLKNGNVSAWGSNTFGETNVPSSIQGDVTGIDAGLNYSLALLKNGQIVGWGKNAQNQTIIPSQIQFNATGMISAGAEHALTLLKDGGISGWGTNFSQIPSSVSCGQTFDYSTGYANIYVLFESNVSNRQPNPTAQACPRINVFLDPIVPPDITEPGFYKYSFFLNGTTNKRCGIDVIAWNYIGGVGVRESQEIEIESCPDFTIVSSRAGEFNDQIRKQINIVWPGNYYFRIKIS